MTSKPHIHVLGDEDLSNYDRWENYPAWSFPKLFSMLPYLETKCRVDHPMLHKLEHGGSCVYWINYKYKRIQLISSHSARRSFVIINTLRNIPRNKILRATGHSSEKAFVRYICYDEDS